VISVVSEVLESVGAPFSTSCEMNNKNFDALHPDSEKSQILSSIDRLCTQPYHNPVRKSWLFLPWLVGQLEFENWCLFSAVSKEAAMHPKSSKSFA